MRDLSALTIRKLARKGITVLRSTSIPDMSSNMPWACASRGYSVNDNGCGRIWTFAQVMEAAA
jgi:hypothetical protein